jgi:hypothetical protein
MPKSFLGYLSLPECTQGTVPDREKPGLTDHRGYANIAFKMKGYGSFFYAYFYGAQKAAVASR